MSMPSYMNHINQMSNNASFENMPKCLLYNHISSISFAIDDLRLFLDTHPNDREALSLMRLLMKLRHQAVSIYTKKYGPINSYMVDIDRCDDWEWTEYPNPWQKGGK